MLEVQWGGKKQCNTLTSAGRETSAGGQVEEEQVSLMRLIDRGRSRKLKAGEVTFKIKRILSKQFPNTFTRVLNPSTLCLFELALLYKRSAE